MLDLPRGPGLRRRTDSHSTSPAAAIPSRDRRGRLGARCV